MTELYKLRLIWFVTYPWILDM